MKSGIRARILTVITVGILAGCQAKYENEARATAATHNAESAASRAEAAAQRAESAVAKVEAAAQRAEQVARTMEQGHARRGE